MSSLSRTTGMLIAAALALSACGKGDGAHADRSELRSEVKQGQATLDVAESFLTAIGSGDMATLETLMADDFVWHNEGDDSLPWIGTWAGKETVLNTFLPAFGAGLTATSWSTDYSMAMGDQAIFMGKMNATANNTGASTGEMSWAVRVQVADGKIKSWNWFEDSYAVSQAYHASAE